MDILKFNKGWKHVMSISCLSSVLFKEENTHLFFWGEKERFSGRCMLDSLRIIRLRIVDGLITEKFKTPHHVDRTLGWMDVVFLGCAAVLNSPRAQHRWVQVLPGLRRQWMDSAHAASQLPAAKMLTLLGLGRITYLQIRKWDEVGLIFF